MAQLNYPTQLKASVCEYEVWEYHHDGTRYSITLYEDGDGYWLVVPNFGWPYRFDRNNAPLVQSYVEEKIKIHGVDGANFTHLIAIALGRTPYFDAA